MDGGSTDNTISILRSLECPELSWRSEPDEGIVDAVNKTFRWARGDILTIQSSDDVFVPGAVQAAVSAMTADPEIGLVYGDVELMDDDSCSIGADVQGPFDLACYFGRFMYVPQPGTFFTRKALEAVGGWRSEFSYTADADFWFRIALRFPVRKLNRIMGSYRYHSTQRDRHRTLIARDWELMVNSILASRTVGPKIRRYARSGIFLARHRYADQKHWWKRTQALYGAILVNPAIIADHRFPKRELLPARQPIWTFLSYMKRWLGFRPRGT